MGGAADAFIARLARSEELRCESRKPNVSGTLDDVARPQYRSMGIFYCERHRLYHGYSFHKFQLVVAKDREAYLSTHRSELVAEVGQESLAKLMERHNSKINQIFRLDRAAYAERHAVWVARERNERVISAIRDLGFTPEQADEFYVCYRKQPHPTPAHAREHMVSLRQSPDFNGGELQSYQCPYCTGWHVGHLTSGNGEDAVLNRREKALEYLRKGRGEVENFYAEKGLVLPEPKVGSR